MDLGVAIDPVRRPQPGHQRPNRDGQHDWNLLFEMIFFDVGIHSGWRCGCTDTPDKS